MADAGATPTQFQLEGAEFLAGRDRALLLDEMRVGKTPAAIRAADLVGARSVLWLTLGNARGDHFRDWQVFSPGRRVNLMLDGKARPDPDGVNITSYDLASGSLWDVLSQLEYDVLACDEMHLTKNPLARRSAAVFGGRTDGAGGYTKRARRCWGLTATLTPNNPLEAWPVLHAWFPQTIELAGKPMTYEQFRDRYCDGYWHKRTQFSAPEFIIKRGKNLDDLKERVRGTFLRRRFAEVAPDVPKPLHETMRLEGAMSPELMAEENGALARRIKSREAEGGDVLTLLDGAARDGTLPRLIGLAKLDPLAERLAAELEGTTHKTVVFGFHRDFLEGLEQRLKRFNPRLIYGGTNARRKLDVIDEFRNDPTVRLMIGQIVSAGTGVDFSVADEIVVGQMSWSSGDNVQAFRRCSNIFKTRQVRIRFASLGGSVDEAIVKAQRRKIEDAKVLFG